MNLPITPQTFKTFLNEKYKLNIFLSYHQSKYKFLTDFDLKNISETWYNEYPDQHKNTYNYFLPELSILYVCTIISLKQVLNTTQKTAAKQYFNYSANQIYINRGFSNLYNKNINYYKDLLNQFSPDTKLKLKQKIIIYLLQYDNLHQNTLNYIIEEIKQC